MSNLRSDLTSEARGHSSLRGCQKGPYQKSPLPISAAVLLGPYLVVQVTVLLFRDGAQLNLFHVLEKPDGSYTPLTDSWAGTSLRNLFASSGMNHIGRTHFTSSIKY